MVILVVGLWHEPDSQLFDTEATETDGDQMPFIACLYHLCVPITSVMNAAATAWHGARSLSLSLSLSPPGAVSLSDQNESHDTISDLWFS